jgi:hypothetical protein
MYGDGDECMHDVFLDFWGSPKLCQMMPRKMDQKHGTWLLLLGDGAR